MYARQRRSGAAALWLLVALFLCLPAGFQAQTAARPRSATAVASQPLDVNTATAAQLKALPGIGDAYTKRIIDGRPYSAKNQLATKGVLPQGTYDRIKDHIVAHRLPKP